MCVTACPYKKVDVNHATGKAEKCPFCFPRIEAGQPTICAKTCVGRLRYLGLVPYDEDAVLAAQASPVWRLISEYQIALPLHPEYRTLPLVWYVPPLSPVLDAASAAGRDDTDADDVFHTIRDLRIPVEYLAELFTAGDADTVAGVPMKLAAMRSYMRARTLDGTVAEELCAAVGMTGEQVEAMYRLLAIAKYDERYVIPAAHDKDAAALEAQAASTSD
jgi:nitrate reductase beta subunit